MKQYNPKIHHRRSMRLKDYDYSSPGNYFITICCQNKRHVFGKIENGCMILNEFGQIADEEWKKLPERFPNMNLDVYQIMPDHNILKIYKMKNEPMDKLWQRNYYERIIHNQHSYHRISQYIIKNPGKWQLNKNKEISQKKIRKINNYFSKLSTILHAKR